MKTLGLLFNSILAFLLSRMKVNVRQKTFLATFLAFLFTPSWALTQTVVTTIPIPVPGRAIAANPLTNKIYVAESPSFIEAGTVTLIDGVTNATSEVAVGLIPVALAVNPKTNRIYVANQGVFLKNQRGNVSVIDGRTFSVITTITDPNATFLFALAVNSMTNKIYVANAHNVTW